MAGLKEYKCPECGGPLEWNAQLQKMKCPYCDSQFTVKELEERTGEAEDLTQGDAQDAAAPESQADVESNFGDIDWQESEGVFSEEETAGMRVYSCESCGAQLIASETAGAMTCPYCSNNVVMTGQFAGDLKPDVVIPFKLDKNAAKASFKRHVNSRKFVPRIFRESGHIDEIKAVYVPYWLFDATAQVDAAFDAKRISVRRQGNMELTDTSIYRLTRGGEMNFEKVPADGSRNIADDLMESIEPFDYQDAVPFNTAYLAGYLADRYDVTAKECMDKAYARMQNSAKSAFTGTLGGYSQVTPLRYNIDFKNGRTTYALYPVWLLNTTWKGEKYLFAMNGQTGKFVGDLPMDKSQYYKEWAILSAVIGGILYAGMWLVSFL